MLPHTKPIGPVNHLEMRTGTGICASSVRVTPPSRISFKRA
jgi:hypothetical protein